mgnify:CR=1 FL=1
MMNIIYYDVEDNEIIRYAEIQNREFYPHEKYYKNIETGQITNNESNYSETDSLKWVSDKKNIDVINKRKEEYGSVEKQIEHITEHGLDSWIAKVNDIKNKNPKF